MKKNIKETTLKEGSVFTTEQLASLAEDSSIRTNINEDVASSYDTYVDYGKYTMDAVAKIDVLKNSVEKYATVIDTDAVTNKTVEGYYQRIKNNMNVSGTSMYYVCRDLYQASVNLVTTKVVEGKELQQFEKYWDLLELLDISRSTVEKYIAIGKSRLLKDLKAANKLPTAWTTMYHLTTLNAGELDKVKSEITSDISIAKINRECKDTKVSKKTDTFKFLDVSIRKDSIDSEVLDNVKGKIMLLLTSDEYISSLISFKFNGDLKSTLLKREQAKIDSDNRERSARARRHQKKTANGKDKSIDDANIASHFVGQTKRLDKVAYKI